MYPVDFSEAVDTMKGAPVGPARLSVFPPVSIDSRTIMPGDAFFAIKGPNFDGHRFLDYAIEKGASAAVISDSAGISAGSCQVPIVQVEDTSIALQRLSRLVRTKWGGKIIAVTGSMGKTTTRNFTASILRQAFNVHETSGNLNNEFGVPLTLLNLDPKHDLAVLELGMNHAGEIRRLSEISLPDIGLITNIAPVHLEFFASLREIAEAKAELLEFLPENGHFFLNGDDPELTRLSDRFAGGQTRFGFGQDSQVQIMEAQIMDICKMKITIRGRVSEYSGIISSVGKPGAYNAGAAVAVAEYLGVEPDKIHLGLSGLHPPNMRGQVTELGAITLWNDTYNANPRAVEFLLDIIRQLSKFSRKIIVLGDMLELGSNTEKFHREIGEKAAGADLDVIITVGPASRVVRDSAVNSGFSAKSVHWFEDAEEAARFLSKLVEPGDLVAIKGSRGLKLEKIVHYLQETAA